jgi:hypothetical protein
MATRRAKTTKTTMMGTKNWVITFMTSLGIGNWKIEISASSGKLPVESSTWDFENPNQCTVVQRRP